MKISQKKNYFLRFELGDLESKHYEKEKGVRFSKELLNLRKVESTLVRQCKFDEAGPVKARADTLEDKERRAYDEASRAALQRKRAVLLSKQGDEARLFEEKVVSTQKRQQSIRVQDAVNLTQRYENTLADMLSQHTIVRRKVEAFFDRKAAAAGSASDGPVVPRVSEAVRNDAMALIKAILGVLKGTGGVVPEHLRQRLAVFSEMAAKQAAALDVSRAGDKEVDSSSVITAAIAATGQLAAQAASAHDQIKAIGGGSPAARSARSASPPPPAHHDLGSPYHFYGSGSAGAGAAPWDPPARSSPPRYLQQQQQAIIQQSQMSNVVPIYSQQQVLQYHPQQQQQQQQQQQGYPYFPQPFAHQIHPMGGHPFYRF